jgi:prolyl-tRNA editing enzyme YbaK/EbsC (Cys-tRNA(Pro) deacylase)
MNSNTAQRIRDLFNRVKERNPSQPEHLIADETAEQFGCDPGQVAEALIKTNYFSEKGDEP